MERKLIKGKGFFIFCFLLICIQTQAIQPCDTTSLALMENTWREFREIHPFGFQTVALKHRGDTCIFVMSEPSGWVKSKDLEYLFSKYGGHLILGRQSFGYDGALYDAIGCAVLDSAKFKRLEKELFILLYETNYKPYYTDLDNPTPHVYFSDIKLNYDISPLTEYRLVNNTVLIADSLEKTFKELRQSDSIIQKGFYDYIKHDSINRSAETLENYRTLLSNKLFYSKNPGYVIWRINRFWLSFDKSFLSNARKFALDTDLIICTYRENNILYIVGREREVPVTILPPLRSETIALLASLTGRENVFINPDSATIVKDSLNDDTVWATPITLSEKLQNTELGNLMVLSDMMLKAWSENGKIKDLFIDYPQPKSFFTKNGVTSELNFNPKYLWEHDIISYRDRTGCMPPAFRTRGDSISDKSDKLSLKSFDYFANLNNTDLVRINQYTIISRALTSPFQYFHRRIPNPWLQTPSTTVSNRPWGYGGYQLQLLPILYPTKVLERLVSRGFKVPTSLITSISTGGVLPIGVFNAIRDEENALRNYEKAKTEYRKNLITGKKLNTIRLEYEKHKKILAEALLKYGAVPQQSLITPSPHLLHLLDDLGAVPQQSLITPSSHNMGRGFVPEIHNIAPKTKPQNSEATNRILHMPEFLPKWKEELRERVKNKIHKINTIETKGNLYMIYGYILNTTTYGEYPTYETA